MPTFRLPSVRKGLPVLVMTAAGLLAAPAMAAVVELARTVVPTVSLYVNDYNRPARATYRRVGFAQVGEFATIHY